MTTNDFLSSAIAGALGAVVVELAVLWRERRKRRRRVAREIYGRKPEMAAIVPTPKPIHRAGQMPALQRAPAPAVTHNADCAFIRWFGLAGDRSGGTPPSCTCEVVITRKELEAKWAKLDEEMSRYWLGSWKPIVGDSCSQPFCEARLCGQRATFEAVGVEPLYYFACRKHLGEIPIKTPQDPKIEADPRT